MKAWLRRILLNGFYKAPDEATCSFCRLSSSQVGPLVEGPGDSGKGRVFICRACTVRVRAIFDATPTGNVG
jgi:hypothetical protein